MAISDPGLQSLRRGARVALVVPTIFAIFLNAVDNPVAALFAVFGSFALLGFADFGGPTRPRGGAYLILTGVGAVLVLVGTLVCNEPWLAALIGLVVATAARFAGFFGGYFAASVSPIILAYVLAASVPGPTDAAPDRLLGWVVAGLVSTVAGVLLWPRRERLAVRDAAATAATALADAVSGLGQTGGPSTEVIEAMDAAIATLASTASVPQRPAGPSAHDTALAFLVDQLERAAGLVRLAPRDAEVTEQTGVLVAVAATALRQIETTLTSGAAPAELDSLVASCLEAKRAVIERAVDELGRGEEPGRVIEEIDARFTERLLLLLAASALSNAAIIVSGHGPSERAVTIPLEVPLTAGVRGTVSRLRRLVQANAVSTSAWGQESLRAGVAVGAAVLIAGELKLDHAFWVVLGTLSVLRSNAFATGRSALMAAIGTAIGFAVSAGLLALVGFDDTGLWIVVVVGLFLAAYTPQVVGFVAGQICFTIAVVALFNLIVPQGWHTGLVRFEDIAIGSTVSLVVALFFWPRRASVGLRANVAKLYHDLARALTAGIQHPEAAVPAYSAELRAHASYAQYLSETARHPNGRGTWATLLADAAQVRFAIAALQHDRGIVRFDQCGPTRTALLQAGQDVSSALDATGARLEHPDQAQGIAADVPSVSTATRVPVSECLGHHAHEAGPEGPLAAGLDAALVRDLLVEVAALADDALATAATLPNA